ncbi:MAG TPA: DNA polymerase [Candidatus Aenigmarchaeota archaeon]|nr:DNA polymerase [Candidatus Aenigmarchaeota archaeon]
MRALMEFYPVDVDYVDEGGNSVVRIFGLTEEGERVIVLDRNFRQYFYVRFEKPEKVIEKVKKLKVGKHEVVDAKVEEMKILGEPVKVVRIWVNHPSAVKVILDECEKMEGFLEKYERDISFYKRYIMDKKLVMFARTRVKGRVIKEKPMIFDATSVEPLNGEDLKEMKFIAFDIETYNLRGNPRPDVDPIIMISLYFSDGRKKLLTTKKIKKDYVENLEDEASMLLRFIKIIEEERPLFLVGYNSDLFDMPYLKARMDKYKLRMNFSWDGSSGKFVRRGRRYGMKFKGLIHVDLYPFIMNILGPNLKTEVYGLDAVAKELLGEGKDEMDRGEMWRMWEHGGEELERLAEYSLRDAYLTGKLMEKLLFQLIEISKLTSLPLYDVCRVGYSQYVENYLMSHIREFGELIPNRPTQEEINKRFARTYEGAFVYEPEPGLYENLVVLDFRSLYPSIIISHNISPDTLNKGKDYVTPEVRKGVRYSFPKEPVGFLPKLLRNVLERRWRIKAMLKDVKGEERKILDARQFALKTVANASYGYLGFPRSRWYSLECAESITAFGRHYIKSVIEKAERMGLKVVYGDTDSVFLKVRKKSDYEEFLEEVNKGLPEFMELEFQYFCPTGIFVGKKGEVKGAKKKYALLTEDGELIIRGFESVRRDWAEIAKECQTKVLKALLMEKDKEKAERIVKEYVEKLRKHEIPDEKVVIYTTLKKPLSEYKAIGPHVAAAKRAKRLGYYVEPGTILRYVIVEGSGSISERARLYEEYKKGKERYDAEYYINNQIIPAVSQILQTSGLERKERRLEQFFGG